VKRAALLLLTGCAMPVVPSYTGGTIIQATTDPIDYHSTQPRDVAPTPSQKAFGSSCHTTLTFPASPPTPFLGSGTVLSFVPLQQSFSIAVGSGGLIKAIAEARQSVHDAQLYDVRIDVHTTSVLSLVRRDCVEVHASAAALK
jgi:hypothetical protein